MHRTVSLAIAVACALPAALIGQVRPTDVGVRASLDSQYVGDLTALHDKIAALASAIPADKYTWKPAVAVRSISEVFMHIAGEWFTLCPLSVGGRPPADFGPNANGDGENGHN